LDALGWDLVGEIPDRKKNWSLWMATLGPLTPLHRCRGIASYIRERVDQHLRLRMASVILRREIERYRKENQGSLLSREA
jgi:hypothetical protein